MIAHLSLKFICFGRRVCQSKKFIARSEVKQKKQDWRADHLMNKSLTSQITTGIGMALALLILNAATSYRNTLKLLENERWVSHTHQVLTELEATLSMLKDAETGQRGYLLTGEERYL